MKRQSYKNTFIIVVVLCLALMAYGLLKLLHFTAISPTERAIKDKLNRERQGEQQIDFSLSDPSKSPLEIRSLVEKGYNLMVDTRKNAPNYVTSKMSCTNCHFAGGNTTGGKNGGLSLAGVAAVFPRYNPGARTVIGLPQRINYCFERSLNSKPLPYESEEMLALLTYLHWISRGFPIYSKAPWLGFEPLKSKNLPDIDSGKTAYMIYCALCHGTNGEGGNQIPPLWGPDSYNKGAGFNDEETLAAFIYANMPYENANLTQEQAIDIAAFVAKQPRPEYHPSKKHE